MSASKRPTFKLAPLNGANTEIGAAKVAQATNEAIGGKLNVLIDVTLARNADFTVIVDPRINAYSCLLWMPTSADAGNAVRQGMYASSLGKGTATLVHTNADSADMTFVIAIIG